MEEGLSSEPARRAPWKQPDLRPRDWLDAGQSLLKRGGLKALKLRPLADELRVSTGSFYHHFPDFDAYQGRLADYFAEQQIEDLIAAVSRAEGDPIGRIRLLSGLVVRHRLARLGLAMRAWGESDPRAKAAVDRHDDIVLGFLTRCLKEAGFAEHEASLRAYALIACGLGRIHAPHLRRGDLTEDLLRLLCTR
jgi:AcrR family transcriptional regulator